MPSDARWQLLRCLTDRFARTGHGTLLASEERKGVEQNHAASCYFPGLPSSNAASSTSIYRFPFAPAGVTAVSLS